MRRISTFFYGIGQGIGSIFRNRAFSLASVGTMSACLFLLGILYIILINFNYMVREAEQGIGITVFFEQGLSDDEIKEIGDKLSSHPASAGVEFTSAEQAWAKYREKSLSAELAESFGDDNPLADSASYTVYIADMAEQTELVDYARSLPGVRKCNDASDIAGKLASFNSLAGYVSGAVIAVLLLVSVFLISLTVTTGVSLRRDEIAIMKLIGATNFFIKIPFIVEGLIIGLVGALIPLAILRTAYDSIISLMASEFGSLLSIVHFVDCDSVMGTLIPVSLLIGVGTGFIGSSATLRRQLMKIELGG